MKMIMIKENIEIKKLLEIIKSMKWQCGYDKKKLNTLNEVEDAIIKEAIVGE